ncbi:MAG: class I SAM-dependent methyltransferase [Planctomycetes bacterium]|nr:class I SAM-dependent methyltransferase [Planctomycetota bacterium]
MKGQFQLKGLDMSMRVRIGVVFAVLLGLCLPVVGQSAGRRESRIGGYGYRESADFVVKRLGLRRNSVVVDIGAGDGWWSSKMVAKLGPKGVIHAGEVDQKKVDAMKTKWADLKQIKPYLCPTDGTGLETDSCDLAFLSKTYHHLNKDGHVAYLKHLKEVVKPSGKLVIIERHQALASGRGAEHAWLPGLLGHQAEEAGWMMLRCELIPGSDHFMATFVQPEAFAKAFAKRREAAEKKKAAKENKPPEEKNAAEEKKAPPE